MAGECPMPLAPDVLNCSGRGIDCLAGQCVCEPGWTGHGDFVSGSPACHLNIIGVRVLWGLVLVFHALSLVYCIRYMVVRPRKRTEWFKDSAFLAGLSGLSTSVSLIVLGSIRVINPNEAIGTDPAATIMFGLATIGFWSFTPLTAYTYAKVLMLSLKMRSEEERLRVSVSVATYKRILPWTWNFTMLAGLSPMLTLINPSDPSIMFGFAAPHFIILAIAMTFHLFLTRSLITPIVQDIREATKIRADERLSQIGEKISRLSGEVRNQAVFQALSAGIFGCWPYAQRYSSYELPIAWLGTSLIIAVGLNSLLPSSSKKAQLGPEQTATGGSVNAIRNTADAIKNTADLQSLGPLGMRSSFDQAS